MHPQPKVTAATFKAALLEGTLKAQMGTKTCPCPSGCFTCLDFDTPEDPAERTRLEEQAFQRLSDAAVHIVVGQQFYGVVLCSLQRMPEWSIPTMAVDGKHIWFNPAYVMSFPNKQTAVVELLHEIGHQIYLHLFRRLTRNAGRFNYACDYVVDRDISTGLGYTLPPFSAFTVMQDAGFASLCPEWETMTAEQVYAMLPEDLSNTVDSRDDHMRPVVSEGTIKGKIAQASTAVKNIGNLPAGVRRQIDKIRNPKVPWDLYIHGEAVDRFLRVDYHPAVRSPACHVVAHFLNIPGCYIPGLAKEEASTLVIGTDTSGSIDDRLLAIFGAEMGAIMQMADRTVCFSCDAKVHEMVEVTKWDDIREKFAFKGGGGTDFRPVFRRIDDEGIKPTMLIFLTDLAGTFPLEKPDYPVIWAVTKHHATPPPWGEVVVVEFPED
jgi:predicted metal-dependent peptidase